MARGGGAGYVVISLAVLLGAGIAEGRALLAAGETRLLLPRAGAGESHFDLKVEVLSDLRIVAVDAIEVRRLDGGPVAGDAARFSVDPDLVGIHLERGRSVPLTLVVDSRRLDAAGDYEVRASLRVTSADPEQLQLGPPPDLEETVGYTLSRRPAQLSVISPLKLEARIDPWQSGVSARGEVRVSETGGLSGMPALHLVERGGATGEAGELHASAMKVNASTQRPVEGADAADLPFELRAAIGAGRYRLPLDIRSPGSLAPVPLDLELWVRHRTVWLIAGLLAGVGMGILIRLVARRRSASERSAGTLAHARSRIEVLRVEAADEAFCDRLRAQSARLGEAETRAARGASGAAVIAASEQELRTALAELEARRLRAERDLVDLEGILVPAPSDPPEVEALLKDFMRHADDLRHRLERGEVGKVADDLPRLGGEVARLLSDAGRRWLVAARDLLDALKRRMPEAGHAQLVEAVRYALESYAARVAEAAPERLRDAVAAGRNALTAVNEQVYALGFRVSYRDLSEALSVVSEIAPEEAVKTADGARAELLAALEPGDLRDPMRPVEALGRFADRIEEALKAIAQDSWMAETWRGVREAVEAREYARAATTAEAALRQRSRERVEAKKKTRVLEVVRLRPRPPAPQVRVLWDAPPRVGFPLVLNLRWLSPPPQRFAVRWLAEGLGARYERTPVDTATVTFEHPGFASLRALVDIDGEVAPLVAQTRLRVLESGAPGVSPAGDSRRSAVWSLAEVVVASLGAAGSGFALFQGAFTGTPPDYGLAVGLGLLWAFAVDAVMGRARLQA